MTIITALASGGRVCFGYNDGHTCGDSPMPGKGCPWVKLGPWMLGLSGSSWTFNVIQRHAHAFENKSSSAADVVFELRSILDEHRLGRRDDDEVTDHYGIWCILINAAGEIWDIDERLAFSRIPDNVLWARGSGTDYALGADFVLSKQNVCIETRVKTATEAAIAFDLYSGGQSNTCMLDSSQV